MKPDQVLKAADYNAAEYEEDDFTPEMIVRLVQHWQQSHDLVDDGQAGPMTQKTIQSSIDAEWSKAPNPAAAYDQCVDGKWLPWDGPETSQPRLGEQVGYFGQPETSPGSNVMSKTWYRDNIIECHQKLGNKLPGAPANQWIKVHKMVEPYLREALRRATITCPGYAITKLGSYNFRHMQNNPSKSLSMHSFGVAFDINPPANSGQHYAKGKAPKAYSAEYMKRWPNGVPADFVQAFASCGFSWGSDWDEDGRTEDHTFLDPMHFEWVARDGHKEKV